MGVAEIFSSRNVDRFDSLLYSFVNPSGVIIENTAGWINCSLLRSVEVGDHVLLIGRVISCANQRRSPLVYENRKYIARTKSSQY